MSNSNSINNSMRSNAVFSDIDVASAPTTSSNKNGHGSSNNSNNNKNIKKSDGDVASIPSMENHLRSDVISTASTTNGNKMNNSKNVVVGGNNPSLISNSVTGKDTITINKSDIHTTVTRNASTVLLSITGNANHHQPHIRNLLPSLNEENNVPQQQKAQQRRSFPVGSRFSSSSNHADETADKRGDPVDLLLNRPKSNVLSDWSSTNKARITSGKAGKPNKESAVASYNVSSTSEQEPTWSDMSEEMKLSLVMKQFDENPEFMAEFNRMSNDEALQAQFKKEAEQEIRSGSRRATDAKFLKTFAETVDAKFPNLDNQLGYK